MQEITHFTVYYGVCVDKDQNRWMSYELPSCLDQARRFKGRLGRDKLHQSKTSRDDKHLHKKLTIMVQIGGAADSPDCTTPEKEGG